MKRSMTTCLIMLTLAALSNITSAAITNGGFETGDLTGWTPEYANDGSNYGRSYYLYVSDSYHYSGNYALYGYAYVDGDYSPDWTPDNLQSDWARTYAWSDPQNLSSATSIQLYLTEFQSNYNHYPWGWGQEVFLTLDDGKTRLYVPLVENNEQPYVSLFDLGLYTPSTGSDGRTWYGFDVPLSTTYFGGDFSLLNLANTKVGVCWEALSWQIYSQELWSGAAVDDIRVVPEPATICLLGLGASGLIRRKK